MSVRVCFICLFIAFTESACNGPKPQFSAGSEGLDVVLLPTEGFPAAVSNLLEKQVAKDTGLQVRAMLPLGTRDWKPFPDSQQYDPSELVRLAYPAIERLRKNYDGKLYVILTARDINTTDRNLRFVFSANFSQNVAVVSVARMVAGNSGQPASDDVIIGRLRKMILRMIALQYYNLERSADIHEVTYSPLMGLDDLDAMGTVLKKPEKKH